MIYLKPPGAIIGFSDGGFKQQSWEYHGYITANMNSWILDILRMRTNYVYILYYIYIPGWWYTYPSEK
jgi:hypothetical protein